MSFARAHPTASRSLEPRVSSGPVLFITPFAPSGGVDLGRVRRANTRARFPNVACRPHWCFQLSPSEVPTSHPDP